MKIIKYISLLLIVALTGCDNFLEPKSQDKIIPKTIKDLKEFLLGEVIMENSDIEDPNIYLAYMTDDISDDFYYAKKRDKKTKYWGYYTWQAEPEIAKDNSEVEDKAWDIYYHKIFTCNIILEQIEELAGTEEEKKILRAETLFMRSYCYFMLVNLYGEPYENEKQAENALGIPVNEETSILNKRYTRKSLKYVYNKIKNDVNESVDIFEEMKEFSTNNICRPGLASSYLFASRICLFTKDYTNAEKYATLCIKTRNNELLNLNNYKEETILSKANNEILFTYGNKGKYDKIVNTFYNINYAVSTDLISKFEKNDLRKAQYLHDSDKAYRPKKFESGKSNLYGKSFRLSEALLIRAEANAELGELDLAMADIDELKRNRYFYGTREEENDEGETVEVTYEFEEEKADNKEEALEKIKLQRRLELCFEDFRWFDLRRYGMPELTHRYLTPDGELSYTLTAKSKSYTLPIPRKIRTHNLFIERINRPEQKK